MLDAAILPSGAQEVASLPGSIFAQPSLQPGCDPLVDETLYWQVSGAPQDVASFLAAHAQSWMSSPGSGQGGNVNGGPTSYFVFDSPKGTDWNSSDMLDFTVAGLPTGETGIRADAEVVPPGSSGVSAGGPSSS